MAILTPTTLTLSGAVVESVAVAAAGGGDSFANYGTQLLVIKNAGGGAVTVTLARQASSYDGVTPANRTVSVAAGTTALIGPFPTGLYNDTSGRVNVKYSGVSGVKVAVVQMGVV